MTHPDGKPVAGKVVRMRTQAKKNGVNNGDITSFPVFNLTTDGNGKFKYFLPGTFTSQDMNSIHEHVSATTFIMIIIMIMNYIIEQECHNVSRHEVNFSCNAGRWCCY